MIEVLLTDHYRCYLQILQRGARNPSPRAVPLREDKVFSSGHKEPHTA